MSLYDILNSYGYNVLADRLHVLCKYRSFDCIQLRAKSFLQVHFATLSDLSEKTLFCILSSYGSCLDVNRYKYKFLRATTSNIPSSVIKDNRGTKLTIGRGGMLKVQHLVSVAKSSLSHPHIDSAGYQQPSRIAFIEFFVKPEVDEDNTDD